SRLERRRLQRRSAADDALDTSLTPNLPGRRSRLSTGRPGRYHPGIMKRALIALLFCAVGSWPSGAQTKIPLKARPLPLSSGRVTGGPLKRAQDLDAQYLLSLDLNRMMAFLRQRAGLEAKAEPYGGWDGAGRQLTGHIAGHYLSAVSLMWAATGDPRFRERA